MTNEPTRTEELISKIHKLLVARLRKSGLLTKGLQRGLEMLDDVIADKMVEVIRQHMETLILRRVTVDGQEVEVCFFQLHRLVSDEELEEEFRRRHLTPAPFNVLMAVNEINWDFAKNYPNATHWPSPLGNWWHLTFSRDGGSLSIHSSPLHWNEGWWFAGLRKQ